MEKEKGVFSFPPEETPAVGSAADLLLSMCFVFCMQVVHEVLTQRYHRLMFEFFNFLIGKNDLPGSIPKVSKDEGTYPWWGVKAEP